jgi:hypothetical protein
MHGRAGLDRNECKRSSSNRGTHERGGGERMQGVQTSAGGTNEHEASAGSTNAAEAVAGLRALCPSSPLPPFKFIFLYY